MKNILFAILLIFFFALSSKAQTKKDGTPDRRYSSNKQSPTYTTPSPHSTVNSSSRPIYRGQTHSTSHGGTYVGEQNSKTHKEGKYTNPKSNNNYGIHKTK